MVIRKQTRRIALLTPYNGGNLGDSAIQEAVIANLRRLAPEAELYGVTLDPERTSSMHSIPCFPLRVSSNRHYELSCARENDTKSPQAEHAYRRLRNLARKIPALVWLKTLVREIAHGISAYKVLRGTTMLVASGGGQLDDEWGGAWGHPYSLMKWSVLAKAAGTSIVFLSVGVCRTQSRPTKLFLRAALSMANYRSYRDAESRRLALEICGQADGPVVPDLAFSHPIVSSGLVHAHEGRVLQIGISPIAWGNEDLWPTANQAQHERYVSELALFIEELLRSGIAVTLFSSSSPDERIIDELQRRLRSELKAVSFSVCVPKSVGHLIEVLHSVDIVVASRLHGILLSFMCGRPTIALSYDRKVACAMSQMRQSDYCLDIGTFSSIDLQRSLLMLQKNRDLIVPLIHASCCRYRANLQPQYRMLAQCLEDCSPKSLPDYSHVLAPIRTENGHSTRNGIQPGSATFERPPNIREEADASPQKRIYR